MKVHFFDKDGNFLKSAEMEESRIRHRLKIVMQLGSEEVEVLSEALEEKDSPFNLMCHVRVFEALKIHVAPSRKPFYLYLEVPR